MTFVALVGLTIAATLALQIGVGVVRWAGRQGRTEVLVLATFLVLVAWFLFLDATVGMDTIRRLLGWTINV